MIQDSEDRTFGLVPYSCNGSLGSNQGILTNGERLRHCEGLAGLGTPSKVNCDRLCHACDQECNHQHKELPQSEAIDHLQKQVQRSPPPYDQTYQQNDA